MYFAVNFFSIFLILILIKNVVNDDDDECSIPDLDPDVTDNYDNDGKQHGAAEVKNTWLSGKVFYLIDDGFNGTQQNEILNAMNVVKEATNSCITFQTRDEQQSKNWIRFFRGDRCSATVGSQRPNQSLSLTDKCVKEHIIVHEILHTLGFGHEQNRPDRETYVKINWNRISKGDQKRYEKLAKSKFMDLGTEYDYNSIMHYKVKNGDMKGLRGTINPSKKLSKTDIEEIKLLYKCSGTTAKNDKKNIGTSKKNGYLNKADQFYSVSKSESETDCKNSCQNDLECLVSTFLSEFNICFLYTNQSSDYRVKDFNTSRKKASFFFVTQSSDRLTGAQQAAMNSAILVKSLFKSYSFIASLFLFHFNSYIL